MTDNLGYGNIDCFGNENTKTPKLDKMADKCNRFLAYHSNGAVCSSSRVAFLTEKYQQRTGNTCVVTAKSQRNAGLPLSEINRMKH